MLFRKPDLEAIAAGRVKRAYRRWKRPLAVAGGTQRTRVGVLAIDAVTRVRLADITERDARAAGAASLAELEALLAGREGQVYRIDLHLAGADPRVALREKAPTAVELAGILARLARLDAASRRGPWTRTVLELVAERPGVRAPDLAAGLGLETQPFKRDVRKLKELGLTESLDVGYRLAPRGRAVLRALRRR